LVAEVKIIRSGLVFKVSPLPSSVVIAPVTTAPSGGTGVAVPITTGTGVKVAVVTALAGPLVAVLIGGTGLRGASSIVGGTVASAVDGTTGWVVAVGSAVGSSEGGPSLAESDGLKVAAVVAAEGSKGEGTLIAGVAAGVGELVA